MHLILSFVIRATGAQALRLTPSGSVAPAGLHASDLQREIGDVVIDSRLVTPGALFVALPGERADGQDFVPSAFSAGARASLVSSRFTAHASLPGSTDWSRPSNDDARPAANHGPR